MLPYRLTQLAEEDMKDIARYTLKKCGKTGTVYPFPANWEAALNRFSIQFEDRMPRLSQMPFTQKFLHSPQCPARSSRRFTNIPG